MNVENVLKSVAELENPQVLLPLATIGAVDILLNYFNPRDLICYNPNRKQLLEIPDPCYKLPANFLRADSRVSLVEGAVDLAYLDGCHPGYWYIAYNYVVKGGYMVGQESNPDERFERWASAVKMVGRVIRV